MDRTPLIILGEILAASALTSALVLFFMRKSGQKRIQLELDAEKLNLEKESRELLDQEREKLIAKLDEDRKGLQREIAAHEERARLVELRAATLDELTKQVLEKQDSLINETQSLAEQQKQVERKLERVAGMTLEEAKQELQEGIEDQFRQEAVERAKKLEAEILKNAELQAKRTVLNVIERNNVEYVLEATSAVITLPSEEMKGRLIGREGRNIRTFEQVTGVDLIIDDSPEAVVVSSFDPVRRETARLALMNLILDGRIHPGRIEELFEQAKTEVERSIREAGQRAADRAGCGDLPNGVTEGLGRLRFRQSMGQNVLDHSVEVSVLSSSLAAELGFNEYIARTSGLLHDIGKGLPPEWEGPHAISGMEYLKQFEFGSEILNAVGAHHYEIEPKTPEAQLVIIADSISASRPGARRESLDHFVKRLEFLEQIAMAMPGVSRAYAVQSGRELRVVVKPDMLDDMACRALAKDLAKRIETERSTGGSTKIVVIRETRHQEVTRG